MLLSNILLVAPFIANIALAIPPLPKTCPIGKICPWGWGQIYTIYEDHPDLSVAREYDTGSLFEVSQKVDDDCQKRHQAIRPHSRVYTVMHMQFTGLGGNGCSLNFNIPCNSSVPFYHHGHAVVAARTINWPGIPTWNNVVEANPPVIGREVLGTFNKYKRGTFEVINKEVCGNQTRNELAFVFGIDERVKESASVKWNQTLMNSDIVVGAYVNFTC